MELLRPTYRYIAITGFLAGSPLSGHQNLTAVVVWRPASRLKIQKNGFFLFVSGLSVTLSLGWP